MATKKKTPPKKKSTPAEKRGRGRPKKIQEPVDLQDEALLLDLQGTAIENASIKAAKNKVEKIAVPNDLNATDFAPMPKLSTVPQTASIGSDSDELNFLKVQIREVCKKHWTIMNAAELQTFVNKSHKGVTVEVSGLSVTLKKDGASATFEQR